MSRPAPRPLRRACAGLLSALLMTTAGAAAAQPLAPEAAQAAKPATKPAKTQALAAQDDEATTAPDATASPDGSPASADASWLWPQPDWALDAQAPEAQRKTELERRVIAAALVATGIPMLIYGLRDLAQAPQDHTQRRHVQAHQAGALLFAGMGQLATAATILHADSPEAQRRAPLAALMHLNPVLPLMAQEAERGHQDRTTKAAILMVGGLLTGAFIAAAPISDQVVDRRVLVGVGAGLGAASLGGAAYMLLTPSPEERVLHEAQQRQLHHQRLLDAQARLLKQRAHFFFIAS